MPRRSTLALESALENFVAEYGRDPGQQELVKQLRDLQKPIKALANTASPGDPSPGQRAAARAAGHSPSPGEKSPMEAARALMGAVPSAEGTPS